MPSLEQDDLRVQSEGEDDNGEETGIRGDGAYDTSAGKLDTHNLSNGDICDEEDKGLNDDSSGCVISTNKQCSKGENNLSVSEKSLDGGAGEENRNDEEDEDEDEDLPIDKGWAWVVLAGVFLNVAVMIGYIRGLSILFIEYLRVFNASAAKTTLLMGVNAGVYSISALLSMHILVSMVGIRKTLFIGAGISVLGMASAIAPTSIDFLIGTHSVLLGIGNSMVFGPGVVIIGQYFKKRHGLASALSMSGISFGGGIFPPLIRFLLDKYGLQGTMIILTGLSMNLFVGAAVCLPLDFFRKKKATKQKTKKISMNCECAGKVHDKNAKAEIFARMNSSCSSERGKETYISVESPFLMRKRLRAESNGSSISRSTRNILLYASQPELGSVVSMIDPKTVSIEEMIPVQKTETTTCVGPKKILSALDFTLFKKPMFLLVVSYSFFNVNISLNGAYLPALASEKGISQSDAALFLTILGGIDFVCRLFIGLIIDKGYMKVNKMMAVGLILLGTASHFSYFYNSYTVMLVFTVIIGMSTCTYFGLIPVAIVEFMGLEYMGKTLGFISLFHGMAIAIANPIVGGIRDATGSYTGGYSYMGVCAYIGATLLLCEPFVRKYQPK